MNTIMIMAQALSKAAGAEVTRLDIQYNRNTDDYTGVLWLKDVTEEFILKEDGTVTKRG